MMMTKKITRDGERLPQMLRQIVW